MLGVPRSERALRLWDALEISSICFLVCWCMKRAYDGRSLGGAGEKGRADEVYVPREDILYGGFDLFGLVNVERCDWLVV